MKKQGLNNWKPSLAHLLSVHNRFNVDGSIASFATQDKYVDVLNAGFKVLQAKGIKLDHVESFRGKHMEILAKEWEQKYYESKLSPATIQSQFSVFRVFSTWIGKHGMVEASHKYVNPEVVRRHTATSCEKSWSAQGIDVNAKIDEVCQKDARVGLQLKLEAAFGLRAREAMQLRPHLADKGAYLDVSVGTKGGRPRAVPIDTPEKRVLIRQAKSFAASKHSSISDPTKSLAQVKNHYYHVLRSCGVTRKEGITGHGLRHGYANDRYHDMSGQASPVRGGKGNNWEDDRAARTQVAEELGHSRTSITAHYLGRAKDEDNDE